MFQSALPALGLLIVMVLLAWGLQRWKSHLPGRVQHAGPLLKVLGSVSLGPQQRLVTVQVGQGSDATCLVLGVAPGGVNALHSMPLPNGSSAADASDHGPAFADRLSQWMGSPAASRPNAHAPE